MSPSVARALFAGLEWGWRLLGVACLGAAAASLAIPDAAQRWAVRRERTLKLAARLLFGLAVPLAACLFKEAQYRGFQLMWDSGVFGNLVWRVARGYGLTSSVIGGQPYLVVHFTWLPYLLAPLTRLTGTLDGLVLAQAAALGSTILATYLLAAEVSGDEVLAWLLALLALSTIYFHDLLGAVLDNSLYALPLFVWAAYCVARKRWGWAAVLAALLLATREHAPFVAAGGGLYLALTGRGKTRWAGAALVALAAGCWLAEMSAIRRCQALWADPWTRWSLFDELGGSPEAARALALRRPWALLAALAWPPAKLAAPAAILGSLALLPLAGGRALVPALVAWLPNQLAGAGHAFHQLRMHYSAFVYGPLIFAAAHALARFRDRRRALCVVILAAAGAQFLANAEFALATRLIPSHWSVSVPRALALIPPDASVWADEFLLPQVCLRPLVKSLPHELPDTLFETGFFTPDRVLMSLYWAQRAQPAAKERVFAFLKSAGLEVVFQDADLLVWARPAR